ncbi:MAG: hypothetical protein Q9192_000405 [Flavoplaca navasiana]
MAAYHTNRAVFAEDVGRRLENLFWRIWSSHRLQRNITGTLVAAIFSKISEGGYIRTTPTQSPRSSRTFGTLPGARQFERSKDLSKPVPSMPSGSESRLLKDDDAGDDAEETETESKMAGRKKIPPRPPPILKKPKSISPLDPLPVPEPVEQTRQGLAAGDVSGSDLRDSARPQSQARSLERLGKTARFSTHEVKSSHYLPVPSEVDMNTNDEAAEPQGKIKSSFNRRKAAVVASTGASKRRPVMRQRSSQTTSNNPLVPTSSQTEADPVSIGAITINTPVKDGSSYPPQSRHQTASCTERPREQRGPATEVTSSSSVSRHDRATHLESTKEPGGRTTPSHTSFTSPPSILKGSVAAAAPASYQATGTMDMGQRVGLGTDRGSVECATARNHSSPNIQTSEDSTQALTRTKSQLTMLLQKDRTASSG